MIWKKLFDWCVFAITCRNLRGRSPLVRAPGMASGSSTLVRKASLPSFVQPIHVPPPRTSLPPRIFFEPSPHHPTALVGLHQFIRAKSADSIHQEHHRQSATCNSGGRKAGSQNYKLEWNHTAWIPAMELISVEQQEELVLWVSLPNPCSYTHGFRFRVVRQVFSTSVFVCLRDTFPCARPSYL